MERCSSFGEGLMGEKIFALCDIWAAWLTVEGCEKFTTIWLPKKKTLMEFLHILTVYCLRFFLCWKFFHQTTMPHCPNHSELLFLKQGVLCSEDDTTCWCHKRRARRYFEWGETPCQPSASLHHWLSELLRCRRFVQGYWRQKIWWDLLRETSYCDGLCSWWRSVPAIEEEWASERRCSSFTSRFNSWNFLCCRRSCGCIFLRLHRWIHLLGKELQIKHFVCLCAGAQIHAWSTDATPGFEAPEYLSWQKWKCSYRWCRTRESNECSRERKSNIYFLFLRTLFRRQCLPGRLSARHCTSAPSW